LLRSLVVSADVRGRGFGGLLTDTAEALAVRLGVTSIYLLTTSADAFFVTRGYQRVDEVKRAGHSHHGAFSA
jgi:amino-acid N-acetyltransferase